MKSTNRFSSNGKWKAPLSSSLYFCYFENESHCEPTAATNQLQCSCSVRKKHVGKEQESKRLSAHHNVPVSILTTSDLVSLSERSPICNGFRIGPRGLTLHCGPHLLRYWSCEPHLHTQIWHSLHVQEWTPLLGWRSSVWLRCGSVSRSDDWTRSSGAESCRDQTGLIKACGLGQTATKQQELNLTVMEEMVLVAS